MSPVMAGNATPQRIGVYPGTFDPITTGHLDIIARASRLLDRLVIGVAGNAGKGPLFTLDERVAMVTAEVESISGQSNALIIVKPFNTLLIQFAAENAAQVIVRGLRAVSDFEYEFQMAGMNTKLNPDIETMFLMAADGQHFISSRFVKEIGKLGGDIGRFVTANTALKLQEKFTQNRAANTETAKQTPPF